MTIFSEAELAYLREERRLARLATVGRDGMPHIAPVGMWSFDASTGTLDIDGRDLAATKKFRDVAATGRAAIVIDDVRGPWQPRGIEVRGLAEAITSPRPLIRIRPRRIVSWGIDEQGYGRRSARDVG
jgi:pyridoxamine 5'-phosphate oxidase family protein